MSRKPTDGPWESAGTVIWSPSAKAVVACVSKLRPVSGMVEFEKPDVFDADRDEIMANRDLIVAAPSLLAALENTVCFRCENRIGWTDGPTRYGDWANCDVCRNARAAIKQAKGETP